MKFRRTLTALFAALALLFAGCGQKTETTAAEPEPAETAEETVEETPAAVPAEEAEPAEETGVEISALDPSLTYYADITVKDYGKITVKLDQSAAPITCANFVDLAERGFYDGVTFHRIMEGFMMQGGDPTGTGGGGAGRNIPGEFAANGVDNPISHLRGAISMARATPFDSASSQFFIVHEDSTFLDGMYAAFGEVTEGMDVVDAVCTDAEPVDDNGTILPEAQPVMESVVIRTEPAE